MADPGVSSSRRWSMEPSQALRGRNVSIGDCLAQGLEAAAGRARRRLPRRSRHRARHDPADCPGSHPVHHVGRRAVRRTPWNEPGSCASLGRSRALTRGRRWRVFGAIMVPIVDHDGDQLVCCIGVFFGLHARRLSDFPSRVVGRPCHRAGLQRLRLRHALLLPAARQGGCRHPAACRRCSTSAGSDFPSSVRAKT